MRDIHLDVALIISVVILLSGSFVLFDVWYVCVQICK